MATDEQPMKTSKPVVHRKSTPPPPIVSYEDVVATCGHTEKFGLFEDRKDKFRKDRRKKVSDRPCRACRETKRLEDEKAALERKAEKKLRAEQAAAARTQKQPAHDHGRLPDGAKVEATFDATHTKWSGSLTIGEQVFTDSASALFTLLRRLDKQYWQSLPPAT